MACVENTHEAIIDADTWERVQELRKNKRRPTRTGKTNLFSGIVRCADCGEKLYYCTSKNFEARQDHFVCSTSRRNGKEGCPTHFIRAVVLEQGVLAHMRLVIACVSTHEERFRKAMGAKQKAEAKKELADKDEEIAGLNKRLKELLAEKARLQELHKSEIGKLRNGYQKEIEAAIRRAETAEQQSKEKDAVIDRQRKRIAQLDRNANPQRYSLSSGAELVRINVSNYRNPSLHIWTKVGEELFEDTKFQIDYDVAQKHFNGQITDEEFVNAVFEPQEQVSVKQAELLGAAFTLAAGGPAEVHVGTGGGGSSSELPWRDKDKYSNKQTTTRR